MECEIFFWICLAMVAKSLLIGREFSFGSWLKHGGYYSRWYFDRETWGDKLKQEGKD